MSAPPAMLIIMLPICAAQAALVASSAAFAAGAPGVPAAAIVAASATCITVSDTCLAPCRAPAAAAGTPRQAGIPPIHTVGLPGPTPRMGGAGWATLSVTLAAGLPAITRLASVQTDHRARDRHHGVRLDVHVLRRLHAHAHPGLHLDPVGLRGQFDRDIRSCLDRYRVRGAVDHDPVASRLVDDFDGFIPRLVVETENVAAAGLDGAMVVLSIGIGFRRIVLPIPQATDHERMIHLSVLE